MACHSEWQLPVTYIYMTLSDSFIQSVLERIDSPEVVGVGIVGSYARGQESKYSDVDLDIYVSKLPENKYERYTLRYLEERLVSLKYAMLEEERSALTNPRRAIWAVPGLRGMKILVDKALWGCRSQGWKRPLS